MHDEFGNVIDPVAGFARGTIIDSSTAEGLRLKEGQRVAAFRVAEHGADSIAIFTGNKRDYLVRPEDLDTLCEEWVGPGIYADDLRSVALAHLGGAETDEVAVLNRTSAAIIATIISLSHGQPILSVVPNGGTSHASVIRGAKLAAVPVTHVEVGADWSAALTELAPRLVIITTVTSSLERMLDGDTMRVVAAAQSAGAVVLLDEAYGARLRTALHSGIPSLLLGAQLTVTNCDKAGLSGPRAGVLAGEAALVAQISATAAGLGMEARAPIAAGAMRSLQAYQPEELRMEAREGAELAQALAQHYPEGVVHASDLGPMIHEDDIFRDILRRANLTETSLVPAEVSSALGMILLRDHGILTVNTHGQPGARVSLRLKPTPGAIATLGGVQGVISAVLEASMALAELVHDVHLVKILILGGSS